MKGQITAPNRPEARCGGSRPSGQRDFLHRRPGGYTNNKVTAGTQSARVALAQAQAQAFHYIICQGAQYGLLSSVMANASVDLLRWRDGVRVNLEARGEPPTDIGSRDEVAEDDADTTVPTTEPCTHACLLGLKHNLELVHTCPDADSHLGGRAIADLDSGMQTTGPRPAHDTTRHKISLEEFSSLISKQLQKDMFNKCRA
ncbi:hypothetical protein B0T17DRAFT_595028 [Bombardia bombarda]|uniref:Uncharacterized protein n=1 Tax=Bombardia bombarda TaxID=252184 RepID=A0AA39XJT5_9PEZI|nr:hypothetical protein B0T17DRAFT_595028 [Bombardia bombarda]